MDSDWLESHQRANVQGTAFPSLSGDTFFDAQECVEPAERSGANSTPSQIASFKVRYVLGEGGMGLVYCAEQEFPKRLVALKVIRSARLSDKTRKRFRREASVLARLHHPNIAQIHLAGECDTDAGSMPFIALEFIDGQPLTTFARGKSLSIGQRVELLIQVCDAVQFAHEQGIIHRDLKPSNILVDGKGMPKLVDFGLSAICEPHVQELSLQTEAGQLLGTLEYMSPEQLQGNASPDVRCDVYSLGVIAFELFAGRRPFVLAGRSPVDAIKSMTENEPSLLSSIDQRYRGDLDTIVAKALEKDVGRRYATVGELAADLRRHLRNEPILACKPSLYYRFGKYVRRNKALVVGASVVCLALTIGVIGTSWQASKARAAARAAQERLAQSLVAQGDVLLSAGNPTDARNRFLEAADHFDKLGASAFPARLGVWEAETKSPQPIRAWPAHSGPVKLLAISSNGIEAVSAGSDNIIKVWDLVSQVPLAQYRCTQMPEAVVISPYQRMVAVMGHDGAVTVWDQRSDNPIFKSPAAVRRMSHTLQLSSNGDMIVWGASLQQLMRWQHGHEDPEELPPAPGNIRRVVFEADESIVILTEKGGLHRLRFGAGTSGWEAIPAADSGHRSLVASPNGRRLFVQSNNVLREVTPAGLREFLTLKTVPQDVAMTNSTNVVSYEASPSLRIIDTESSADPVNVDIAGAGSAKVSGDGAMLLVGRESGSLTLLATAPRHLIQHLRGGSTSVYQIAAHPTLPVFLTIDQKNEVSLWHADTGVRLCRGKLSEAILFAALLPDSLSAVVVTGAGSIALLDLDTLKLSTSSDVGFTTPAALLGDHVIVAGGEPHGLWSIALATMAKTRLSDSQNITALAAANGTQLVAADDQGVLHFWRDLKHPPIKMPTGLARLDRLIPMKGNTFIGLDATQSLVMIEVNAAASSATHHSLQLPIADIVIVRDNDLVFSSPPSALHVWSGGTRTLARTFHAPVAMPMAMAAFADGGFAVGTDDGSITLYKIPRSAAPAQRAMRPSTQDNAADDLLQSCREYGRAGLHRLALAAFARLSPEAASQAADTAISSSHALGLTQAARDIQAQFPARSVPQAHLRRILSQPPSPEK